MENGQKLVTVDDLKDCVCLFLLKLISSKSLKKLDFEVVYDISPILILVSVLSARLYYVLINWEYYSRNLLDSFNLTQGGWAIHGARLGGLITLIIMLKMKKR